MSLPSLPFLQPFLSSLPCILLLLTTCATSCLKHFEMSTVWYFRIHEHSPGIDEYVACVILKTCANLQWQEEKLRPISLTWALIATKMPVPEMSFLGLFQILFSLMWAFLASLILCQKTPQHGTTICSLWKSVLGNLTSGSRIVSTWVDEKLPCDHKIQTVDHPVI